MAKNCCKRFCQCCCLTIFAIVAAFFILVLSLWIGDSVTIYYQPNECGFRPGFNGSFSNWDYDRNTAKRNALEREFPWMAKIVSRETKNATHYEVVYCSATLISHEYAITAGHCVDSSPQYRAIIFGKNSIVDSDGLVLTELSAVNPFGIFFPDVRQIKSVDVKLHPEYLAYVNRRGEKEIENDIALVKLNPPIVFGDNIQPICMANSDYSFSSQHGETSANFRVGKTMLWPQDKCEHFLNKPSILCSGTLDTSHNNNGDSGGPVMIRDQMYKLENRETQDGVQNRVTLKPIKERWYQIGVHSFSVTSKGSNRRFLDAATRTSKYCDFIEANSDVKCKIFGIEEAIGEMENSK
uniref:Peptidase S1 domain-containing protein n=1 Tax=Acrobeloides nanus TaxID=290746 RepID=A0A914E6Y4_9BILA